jgi:hypothetical protein
MEELSTNIIREKIYIIRSRKVMFDSDLAMLYEVSTKRLNEAVKRNTKRFPEDFMFQLNKEEGELFGYGRPLRSQIATLKNDTLKNKDKNDVLRSQIVTLRRGEHKKYQPYVFTEQGIAMLSSVLKSDKAISVNIQIIRIFTKLREMIDTYKELREKVEEMERSNTKTFQQIFDIIKSIIQEKGKPGNPIGFTVDGD